MKIAELSQFLKLFETTECDDGKFLGNFKLAKISVYYN
jgi:hypothetical protein